MGKVMNIYGVMIDDTTIFGNMVKQFRETKPATANTEIIEKWVRNLMETADEDFYLYIHKTKEENLYPIIYQGLKIYEENGHLESTMSRAFDSSSVDIEGDINYFLNIIENPNQYGSCSVVAIIPKDYAKCVNMLHSTSLPTVPKEVIAFGTNEHNYIVPGMAYSLEKAADQSFSNHIL